MMSKQSSIVHKRECFRREIRKERLEDHFRNKRKVLFQLQNQQLLQAPLSLWEMLHQIIERRDTYKNICQLTNTLALDRPFQQLKPVQKNNLSESPSSAEIRQFCDKMIPSIIELAVTTKQQAIKVCCYNAISNLLSDPLCENDKYVKLIVNFIGEVYGTLQEWGVDKETIEICCIVSSMLHKNILSASPNHLEKLLEWAQHAIQNIKVSDDQWTVAQIVDGVTIFFRYVDQTYNPQDKELVVEHFLSSRDIVIEGCISKFGQTKDTKILSITCNLLLNNIVYVHRYFIQKSNKSNDFVNNLIQAVSILNSQRMEQRCMYVLICLISAKGYTAEEIQVFNPLFKSTLKTENVIKGSFQMDFYQDNQSVIKKCQESSRTIKKYIILKKSRHLVQILAVKDRKIKLLCLQIFDNLFQQFSSALISNSEYIIANSSQSFDFVLGCCKMIMLDFNLQNCLMNIINYSGHDCQTLVKIAKIYAKVLYISQGIIGEKLFHQLLDVDQEICQKNPQSRNGELSIFMTEIRSRYEFYEQRKHGAEYSDVL